MAKSAESQQIIKEMLLPILNSKSQYLHAEGICQAVYGLAEAEIHDAETWNTLQAAIQEHDFDYQIVSNVQWNPSQFVRVLIDAHDHEEEFGEFCDSLFYKSKFYILFSVYFRWYQRGGAIQRCLEGR